MMGPESHDSTDMMDKVGNVFRKFFVFIAHVDIIHCQVRPPVKRVLNKAFPRQSARTTGGTSGIRRRDRSGICIYLVRTGPSRSRRRRHHKPSASREEPISGADLVSFLEIGSSRER